MTGGSPAGPATGRRRLAYVSLHQARPGQGGHTHITRICSGLEELGWEVDLFSPCIGPSQRRSPWHLVRQFVGPQLRVIRALRRYDAVYVRHHPFALLVTWACTLLGVARVDEVNGTLDDWYDIYPWSRRLSPVLECGSRTSLRQASAVIAVCEGLAEWVRDTSGQPNVHTVPNAADPDVFLPSAPAFPPRVIYAGALTPWEGIDCLLAAASAPVWPPGVELHIAGVGPMEGAVRDHADAQPHVIYVGMLSAEQVVEFVAKATVALSPFHKPPYGASPIKLYEAMSSAVPVVVSDSPGQAEVVRIEGCGTVVSPGDAEAMASAVAELAGDPAEARQQGARGRAAVLARHTWDHRARATDEVLGAAQRACRRRSQSSSRRL